MELSPEELRGTILGQIPWRRCPNCEGEGTEYWMEYTLKESPHISNIRTITAQQFSDFTESDWPDFDWVGVSSGQCDNCDGVGYVKNTSSLPGYMESFFHE